MQITDSDIDDTQVQIDICRSSIDLYFGVYRSNSPEFLRDKYKKLLKEEEDRLDWFKENHPEYFI